MEAFKKIYPEEYYRKFLVHSIRPDGRALTALRKTVVSAGSITTAHGSSFVKIGTTAVTCGIKAEVGRKTQTNLQHLAINVELLPLCSSSFPQGRPSTQSQVFGELINRFAEGIIPPSNFDIPSQDLSWFLYVDIYCLDYNGNVLDAALIALVTALSNVSLPDIHMDSKQRAIASKERKNKLHLQRYPLSLSFGMIDEYIIIDPTAEEESLHDTTFSIVVDGKGKMTDDGETECTLLGVIRPGSGGNDDSGAIEGGDLKICIQRAKQRAKQILEMIDNAVNTPSSSQ